jgi:ABC-type transport system involved in multi-copper enzyme maturation permease subunit
MFLRSLKGQRIGLGSVALGMFGLSLILAISFEAIGGGEAVETFFDLLPDAMKALLGAQGGIPTSAEGFLAADYRHPLYLITLSSFVIASSVGAIAREIERGTVLMLLAAPVARWRFLAAKVGALAVAVVVLALAALFGTWLGVTVTGAEDVAMSTFMRVQVATVLLGFAIGGIGLLVSSLNSDGGQAMGITIAIIVVSYFVDFLSLLWDLAEPLGPLSIFHYYDPLGIARAGAVGSTDVLVLAAVAVVCTAAAFVVFQRRDITR